MKEEIRKQMNSNKFESIVKEDIDYWSSLFLCTIEERSSGF